MVEDSRLLFPAKPKILTAAAPFTGPFVISGEVIGHRYPVPCEPLSGGPRILRPSADGQWVKGFDALPVQEGNPCHRSRSAVVGVLKMRSLGRIQVMPLPSS